ncbi:MAG TPA: hypothetical protein VH120_00705, partial [Gemmataceae bacterium]|nr:hypothetical protein [Gemmataceae bacterium]
FLGITAVGVILGSLAPFGVLMGPFMCGIHLCLLRHDRGQRVSFETLFKGFDYFIDSLIATLIMLVPMIVVIVPAYVVFFVTILATVPEWPNNRPPDVERLFPVFGAMAGLILAIAFISLLVHLTFFFIYPLIVDRRLTGIEAVKTSMNAALANFWGLLGLGILNALIGVAGVMCCYVGAIFVLPITFGAAWIAYRQVFWETEDLEAVEAVVPT